MSRKKILVTGMSGVIGGAVRKRLDSHHELTALNRSAVAGVRCFQADIADLTAIQPAFQGQDVVVHLAADTKAGDGWGNILDSIILGSYNVYEASRVAGVRRVIYASSGAVVLNYEKEEPYKALVEGRYEQAPPSWLMLTEESSLRPANIYGCAKVWGEALGRHYSDLHGLSVIILRIGVVNHEDRPRTPRDFAAWCSQRDVAQMVEKCIEAPDELHYDVFYAVSNNKWRFRDVDHAKEVLGYEPLDNAEQHR